MSISYCPSFVRNLAIWLALRKPAPERIPLSDRQRTSARDYFLVYLDDGEVRWRFLVRGANKFGVDGLWYEDDATQGVPTSIPTSNISDYRPRITQYFGEMEIAYDSYAEFVLYQIFRLPNIFRVRRRIARFFFQRRHLIREDRIRVLQLLVDETIREANEEIHGRGFVWFSAPAIMYRLYGPYYDLHPQFEELRRYYRVLLDSLVESGDLVNELASYRISARSMMTLANYAEDDRRHRDQVRQQGILGVLTFALVAVGAAQAILAYLGLSK